MIPSATADALYKWTKVGSVVLPTFTACIGIAAFYLDGIRQQYAAEREQQQVLAVAQAQENAAKANRDAEATRLEHEKLKEKLAWRVLSRQQIETFNQAVEALGPRHITLAWSVNDTEALNFAIQLSNIFAKQRWTAHPRAQTFATTIILGVHVFGTDSESVEGLRKAFSDAGIPTEGEETPPESMALSGPPPEVVPAATVFIGVKPFTL